MHYRLAALCLACGLALVGCTPPTVSPPPWRTQPPPQPELVEPEPDARPVRVGLLLPLSGSAEALGNDMLQAAQMALFDVGDNRVQLLPRDTRGTVEGASAAAREVLDGGAELIIGPLFGRNASAIAQIAQARGVAVLTFSNDASVAMPGVVYVFGYRPEEQVERVVAYAVQHGHRRIAGLAPDDAYGATTLAALRRAVQAHRDGELGPAQTYPAGEADLARLARTFSAYDRRREALDGERRRLAARGDEAARRALRELQARDTFGDPPFEAVLLADSGARLRQIASLLAFYDVDPRQVRYLGTERWQEDRQALEEPALHGGWYAAPSPGGIESFQRRFERNFGRTPQALAALAYDATALAVILSRPAPDYSRGALTNPSGFAGATGVFRLRPNGLVERGLAILEVRPEGPREIDRAPREFDDLIALR